MLLSATGALAAPLSQASTGLGSPFFWLIDLAAHWQWLYLLVGALAAVVLLVRRQWMFALVGCSAIAFGWFSASPAADSATLGIDPILTVVSANIHVDNNDLEALHRWVKHLHADIVVIQEVSPPAAEKLESWHDYPHRQISPDYGPFGMAVLSRLPFAEVEAIESQGQTLRYRAVLLWGGKPMALSAIHPMPPISSDFHDRRAEMFAEEAGRLGVLDIPGMIVGDLNATPWSTAMRVLDSAGLRRATSLSPSWPAVLPAIPVDHVVVSRDWRVVRSGVGPDVGSDHRPVFAVVILPG